MKHNSASNSLDGVIGEIKHYLPAQAPLKDFVHHNSLHAFQTLKFYDALHLTSEVFGAKMYLRLQEYRDYYAKGTISKAALDKAISAYSDNSIDKKSFSQKMLHENYDTSLITRVGELRIGWKEAYRFDIDSKIHPLLFRYLCNFLDQGIALWAFPNSHMDFLDSLRQLEEKSFASLFLTKKGRAHKLLLDPNTQLEDLLKIVVGKPELYERYLLDQQLVHPGWSGIVSAIEDLPETLLDRRKITVKELIFFELLMEIDHLDYYLKNWKPLGEVFHPKLNPLFTRPQEREYYKVLEIWHTAFESTYYNEVINALTSRPDLAPDKKIDFQSIHCIDDRETTFRQYIEIVHPNAETYSTPGFFGSEFYYQPENGKFFTKLCPAPMTPKYLIKQRGSKESREKDLLFKQQAHSFWGGWLISQTLGFWSAFKLFLTVFRPTMTPATATSLRHMDKVSQLVIENDHVHHHEHGLQVGYTVTEMTDRVYNTFRSIGLTEHKFAPLVYLIGHGASSVNNPYYAAYDCGACSGRPGSVNARVLAHMANNPTVRNELQKRGFTIPRTTRFVGALHDTTRDEIEYFDEEAIPLDMNPTHQLAQKVFDKSLAMLAKERTRRFESLDTNEDAEVLLEKVRIRSVSLFEPRPELNHATNTLCIVSRRSLIKNIFFDRRAFLNSYNAAIDPEGEILTKILSAAVPVCGGINLEYFFSRVDNEKYGAGTKLPHNVMGLIGVANGIDGDLRTGLPSQMIEVHDPIRLLMIVEHHKDVALKAIQRNPPAYEWVQNGWVHYMSIDPNDKSAWFFKEGEMVPYDLTPLQVPKITNMAEWVSSSQDNLPLAFIADGAK
jgi:uncharacterized protein